MWGGRASLGTCGEVGLLYPGNGVQRGDHTHLDGFGVQEQGEVGGKESDHFLGARHRGQMEGLADTSSIGSMGHSFGQ